MTSFLDISGHSKPMLLSKMHLQLLVRIIQKRGRGDLSCALSPNARILENPVLCCLWAQVTRSSRYPLLIDPQGQALNWIRRHEKNRLPAAGVTSFSSNRLRETLEFCMMEGKALIIAGVEEDIDPMLTPVLEKQVQWNTTSIMWALSWDIVDFSPLGMIQRDCSRLSTGSINV